MIAMKQIMFNITNICYNHADKNQGKCKCNSYTIHSTSIAFLINTLYTLNIHLSLTDTHQNALNVTFFTCLLSLPKHHKLLQTRDALTKVFELHQKKFDRDF